MVNVLVGEDLVLSHYVAVATGVSWYPAALAVSSSLGRNRKRVLE